MRLVATFTIRSLSNELVGASNVYFDTENNRYIVITNKHDKNDARAEFIDGSLAILYAARQCGWQRNNFGRALNEIGRYV